MSEIEYRPLSKTMKDAVDREIEKVMPQVVGFRHTRHQHPELTWKEADTARAIADELATIPHLKVETEVAKFGVVATLTGNMPGPVIALRADMDALPVIEKTNAPYASKRQGVMHACGHDGHMANLIGAARVLSSLKDELQGTVKFVFQPAEEGGAGARAIAEAGALKNPDVDMIFGLHGWPSLEVGKVFVKSGPFMAAHSEIHIKVRGTGCHAAMPHLGTDQILTAARVVEALQSISSRVFAPVEPVALTIGTIHGGVAFNVIPDEVTLSGTLRTVTKAGLERATDAMHKIAKGVAIANRCEIDLEIKPSYPAVINHDAPTNYLEKVARDVIGDTNVLRMPDPTMASEDFAFYLDYVPGSFFFLGLDDGRSGGYPSLHHPQFDFNDRSLQTGMRIYSALALSAGSV